MIGALGIPSWIDRGPRSPEKGGWFGKDEKEPEEAGFEGLEEKEQEEEKETSGSAVGSSVEQPDATACESQRTSTGTAGAMPFDHIEISSRAGPYLRMHKSVGDASDAFEKKIRLGNRQKK